MSVVPVQQADTNKFEVITIDTLYKQYAIGPASKGGKDIRPQLLAEAVLASIMEREDHDVLLRYTSEAQTFIESEKYELEKTAKARKDLEAIDKTRKTLKGDIAKVENRLTNASGKERENLQTDLTRLNKQLSAADGAAAPLEQEIADSQKSMPDFKFNLPVLGPPGIGKSTACRKITDFYIAIGLVQRAVIAEQNSEVIVGETEKHMYAMFDKAIEGGGRGAVILEEFGIESGHHGDAVGTLVKAMNDTSKYYGKVAVLANMYSDQYQRMQKSNKGIQSRFQRALNLPVPSTEQLLAAFLNGLAKKGYFLDANEQDKIIAKVRANLESGSKMEGFAFFRGAGNYATEVTKASQERLRRESKLSALQEVARGYNASSKKKEAKAVDALMKTITLADIPEVVAGAGGEPEFNLGRRQFTPVDNVDAFKAEVRRKVEGGNPGVVDPEAAGGKAGVKPVTPAKGRKSKTPAPQRKAA